MTRFRSRYERGNRLREQIQLDIDEAPLSAQLRRMLGPQWRKMRITTVGNQVILFVGSHVDRFEETIANVETGAGGMSSRVDYTRFRARGSDQRTVEFHLSVARTQQMIGRDENRTDTTTQPSAMSSFGLTVAPQRLRLDTFFPYEELPCVARTVKLTR